jgi:hypothetical protein
MKRTIALLTIILISVALGYWIGVIKHSVDEKFALVDSEVTSLHNPKEDFNDFVYKFIFDSLFQLDRIKFPLKSIQSHVDEVDSSAVEKSDWKINRLFGLEQYKAQIYDNFDRELRDTDERLFCWEGIENGINVEYKFKRIGGLWYLIEYNDFSD